jgi:hypothetical protein
VIGTQKEASTETINARSIMRNTDDGVACRRHGETDLYWRRSALGGQEQLHGTLVTRPDGLVLSKRRSRLPEISRPFRPCWLVRRSAANAQRLRWSLAIRWHRITAGSITPSTSLLLHSIATLVNRYFICQIAEVGQLAGYSW